MWGSTRTTGSCSPPQCRGASVVARRKPSIKESSEWHGQLLMQSKSNSITFLDSNSSFDSWFTSIHGLIQTSEEFLDQFSCERSLELMKLFPILHFFHTIKSIPPSYSSPSWKTFKTCQYAFLPPNPTRRLSPTFTLWLQDPN